MKQILFALGCLLVWCSACHAGFTELVTYKSSEEIDVVDRVGEEFEDDGETSSVVQFMNYALPFTILGLNVLIACVLLREKRGLEKVGKALKRADTEVTTHMNACARKVGEVREQISQEHVGES
ncbi:hypothetical protein JW872_02200 [Candidatus Babeliales bacterium]|nr:hypothetical protein [Candidatus Babeliales bacterium]